MSAPVPIPTLTDRAAQNLREILVQHPGITLAELRKLKSKKTGIIFFSGASPMDVLRNSPSAVTVYRGMDGTNRLHLPGTSPDAVQVCLLFRRTARSHYLH